MVLEARDRVGGRCWTPRMPGPDIPGEVGAEFIHGEAKVTFALLRQAGLGAIDFVREQRYLVDGRLRSGDAWQPSRCRHLARLRGELFLRDNSQRHLWGSGTASLLAT